jgi:hypothetical protein
MTCFNVLGDYTALKMERLGVEVYPGFNGQEG